jgi:small subunit ribosomal protein S1
MSTSLPPTKPPAEVHPMQALLDQGGYDMPQRGDIREGTVISVSPQEVVIDLGLKREAIVPANDLSRLEKNTLAELVEGSVWPVYILQPSDREGNLIVSLSRAMQEKDWLVAQQMMESNEMFEAEVSGHNAGGLEVIFGKLRGFVPASHLSSLPRELSPEDRKAHLATYMGKKIPLKVVEVDRKRRRLIMSERAARRRWQREHRKQLLDEIQVGEVRTGIVRSLSEFGAFVDLGGADGLVHISELAWFPVAHPNEVLKVGQQVDVKVLRIDKQRERVGLSLKRVQPDPWSHIDELYEVSTLVEAVVTRVTDFGAFVRLRSGVEGLLHVSEMADIRPDHPQSLVSPGDLLLLRVLRIEPDRRRIGLSLRQVSEQEWAEWAASYREKHGAKEPEAEQAEEPVEESTEQIEAPSADGHLDEPVDEETVAGPVDMPVAEAAGEETWFPGGDEAAATEEVVEELPAAVEETTQELPVAVEETVEGLPATVEETVEELPVVVEETAEELPATVEETAEELPAAVDEATEEPLAEAGAVEPQGNDLPMPADLESTDGPMSVTGAEEMDAGTPEAETSADEEETK